MINKKILAFCIHEKREIIKTVLFQWLALICNVIFYLGVVLFMTMMVDGIIQLKEMSFAIFLVILGITFRALSQKKSAMASYHASAHVKKEIRENIIQKLFRLGNAYTQTVSSAEITQVAMEGADQLEIYVGKYIPQLLISLISPLTLFVLFVFIDWKAALVLLVCVPLIPLSIVFVQKFAKKLLAKYWGAYTELGDSFLENLQGLTTLKIYQADERQTKKMDQEAENFRKITMRVLTMQLNSISVMDIVAYGGSALGMLVVLMDYRAGLVSLSGTLLVVLLASEFFIPMRLLGSYFHIAMNGSAAADKIFRFLEIEEKERGTLPTPQNWNLTMENVSFSYEEKRPLLKNINMSIPQGAFVGWVGKSGSGKSTLAKCFMNEISAQEGSISIGDKKMNELENPTSMVTLVTHNNHLFTGSVRYNLLLAKPSATDLELIDALKRVNLWDFLSHSEGLEMKLTEEASNLSGGQRQRLNLARALLRDTPIYLFDEATSNIDRESESDILKVITSLRKDKTVIMISHRLDYCESCDEIFLLEKGEIVEKGNHQELMQQNGLYASFVETQRACFRLEEDQK